ncbi:flavin reductase family protein [Ahrensia kielensis]|uniref:Flavin reductase family protein n=1 Tax=Ahrensia kielensis TaxID=76980 RepID=A0ABU9T3A4_9HYPH
MNADANLNLDALNANQLKKAMGCFATGVTVVTTHFEGQDYGMTCNSFNTVSLDPAMVLWSIRKASSSHDAFAKAKGYTVNILAAEQADTAMRFTKGDHADRFAEVEVRRLKSGRLILPQASAWFDCDINQIVGAGDHDILIGRVRAFASGEKMPLTYIGGKFVTLS